MNMFSSFSLSQFYNRHTEYKQIKTVYPKIKYIKASEKYKSRFELNNTIKWAPDRDRFDGERQRQIKSNKEFEPLSKSESLDHNFNDDS